MNVPYNFKTGNYMTADEIIARCQQLGVSGMELRAQPVELFLGIAGGRRGRGGRANRGRGPERGGGRQGAGDAPAPAAPARRGRTGAGRRRRAGRPRRRPRRR